MSRTTWLRSIGAPDKAVAQSLARNDSAAVSATMAGAAEWMPAAGEVPAPSPWYMGSDDEGGFNIRADVCAFHIGSLGAK